MSTHMVERLHENHNCMRLVGTSIQKCQLLSVDWPLEIPLPPRRTLLRTGDKLLQIIRLIVTRCPVGTTTTKTSHVARVSQYKMIQRRQNAAEPRSRAGQLIN